MQHPDITLIFIHALNAANDYLAERVTIPVFAYVLPPPGGEHLQRVVPDPSTGRTVQTVIEQLRTLLRQEAYSKGYRAVAVISEMPGDLNESPVLQVAIDHVSAGPITWQVPFRRAEGRYQFGTRDGDGIVTEGKRFILSE